MTRHPGHTPDDCAYCQRIAEDRQSDERDIDGRLADMEAERYERWLDAQW